MSYIHLLPTVCNCMHTFEVFVMWDVERIKKRCEEESVLCVNGKFSKLEPRIYCHCCDRVGCVVWGFLFLFFFIFYFLAQPWVKSAQIKQYLKTVACLVFCPENLCLCSCICFPFKFIQVKNLQTVWVHRRLLVQTANLDKLFPDCNDFCPWAKPVVIILQHLIKFHVPAIPLTFLCTLYIFIYLFF